MRKVLTEEQLLNEALGEFPNQYDLAGEIADAVIDMIPRHETTKEYQSNVSTPFKRVELIVEYSEDSPQGGWLIDARPTKGSFLGADFDAVQLKFFIARNDVLGKRSEDLWKTIFHIAAHELNHAYVLIAQAKYNMAWNKKKSADEQKPLVNPLPEWYEPITKFLANYDKEDICLKFAQALYSCNDMEIKAIISQATPHIANTLSDRKECTRKDFLHALTTCEPYKRFYENLYETLPEARQNILKIKEVLHKWKIDFDEDTLRRLLDYIEQRSTMGLKYVEKNAMLYFHEHIKFGNTDWFKKHPLKKK